MRTTDGATLTRGLISTVTVLSSASMGWLSEYEVVRIRGRGVETPPYHFEISPDSKPSAKISAGGGRLRTWTSKIDALAR